jgi:hypothetical protein
MLVPKFNPAGKAALVHNDRGTAQTHAPEMQAGVAQPAPSEHARASSAVNTHWPLAGLQASSVQGFWSLQTTDGVPTQAPFTQESVVHALPSEHAFASSLTWTH